MLSAVVALLKPRHRCARQSHGRWLGLHPQIRLSGLTDANLLKTYPYYQPDEPGEDRGSPIVGWITGNTYYHYDEHRVLIEALVRVKT